LYFKLWRSCKGLFSTSKTEDEKAQFTATIQGVTELLLQRQDQLIDTFLTRCLGNGTRNNYEHNKPVDEFFISQKVVVIIALSLAAALVVLSATAIIVLVCDFIQFSILRAKTLRQKHKYELIPTYHNVRALKPVPPPRGPNRKRENRSSVYASIPQIPTDSVIAQNNAYQEATIRTTRSGINTTSFIVDNNPDSIEIIYDLACEDCVDQLPPPPLEDGNVTNAS
jgi:hypothetical protein